MTFNTHNRPRIFRAWTFCVFVTVKSFYPVSHRSVLTQLSVLTLNTPNVAMYALAYQESGDISVSVDYDRELPQGTAWERPHLYKL